MLRSTSARATLHALENAGQKFARQRGTNSLFLRSSSPASVYMRVWLAQVAVCVCTTIAAAAAFCFRDVGG